MSSPHREKNDFQGLGPLLEAVSGIAAARSGVGPQNYEYWLKNIRHPATRFKPFYGRMYSARVGDHYRAVGYFSAPNEFIWIWIGSHEDYNKFRG